MSAVSITSPKDDGDDFPSVIEGEYTLSVDLALESPQSLSPQPPPPPGLSSPTITVLVTREDTADSLPTMIATVAAADTTSGSWSVGKPGGLVAGKTYTITASLNHPDFSPASDSKKQILA